ncbi:unnamed protein product [Ixodes pacificus]
MRLFCYSGMCFVICIGCPSPLKEVSRDSKPFSRGVCSVTSSF